MMIKYPKATYRASVIKHPQRTETRGIVIHWTAGHEAGDLSTLDGPAVDVHFYVDKKGKVFQFLDPGSVAWHAFHTANYTCIGIEHEGSGEAWTPEQLDASAELVDWLTRLYNVPIAKVDPHHEWHGIFGHADLHGIDGNDHTDSVPAATGWTTYLERINHVVHADPAREPVGIPSASSLSLMLKPKGGVQRVWKGADASWAMRWVVKNGLKPDTTCRLVWQKKVYEGPAATEAQCKALVEKFLS